VFPSEPSIESLCAKRAFYYCFEEEPVQALLTRHGRGIRGPGVMHLRSATLVIVSVNLLNQWSGKINKYCRGMIKPLTAFETDPLAVAQLATGFDVRTCHPRKIH
jgi:hypothetical protein